MLKCWVNNGEEWDDMVIDPLVICDIAIENDHLQRIFPVKMEIVHSHVSLPEGNE